MFDREAYVNGASIRYFERYSIELLGSSTPRLIVLAVGINDAHVDRFPSFRSRYQKTVTEIARRAPVLLTTVAPVELDSLAQMSEFVPRINEAIKETTRPGAVIDLNVQMTGANLTTDGVHLNDQGYDQWAKAMIGGIAKALGCNA